MRKPEQGGEDAPCRWEERPEAELRRRSLTSTQLRFLVCEMGTGWRGSAPHMAEGAGRSTLPRHRLAWGQGLRRAVVPFTESGVRRGERDAVLSHIPQSSIYSLYYLQKEARSSLGHFRSCVVERIHKICIFSFGASVDTDENFSTVYTIT